MDMKNIRHFIWDFDGTLFDTYPVIIENLNLALEEFGGSCDMVEAMVLMQQRIATAQNHYAAKFGIDRQALVEAYERYHRRANAQLRAQPVAGVRKVLEQIRSSGRFSYIFSHRKPEETVLYLEKYGLSGYFRDIIGPGSEGFAEKPAPDAVLYLMEKYGMTPDQTVMVGDRECDLGSGRNAGIRVAHLLCPMAPETLECTWRLDDFEQMLEMLRLS